MSEFISDVIARADAKGKILDFRNNLVLAKPIHYAMMQGAGGKEFAPNSTIKVSMTDYSSGTGEKSVHVSANITPDVIARILGVCERNTGTVYTPQVMKVASLENALNHARSILQSAEEVTGDDGKKKITMPRQQLVELGKLIASARDEVELANGQALSATAPNVCFEMKQEKVNVYGRDAAGLVPVSSLLISRQGIRKDGQVSRLPWSVKISTFKAAPISHANGTTSYDGKTATAKKEVFINVSDDAMHRCCYRCLRFIETWENANCIPVIARAIAAKEQARIEAASNQN